MKNFALIGAAGYVAPRHLQAIKAVGGTLRAAYDPSDSVGIIDSYFPDAEFHVGFERFGRRVEELRTSPDRIEYVSICSPNHLHESHCRFALRADSDAICEKPLVLDPRDIDTLAVLERETGRTISTVLQLRLHPAVKALKDRIEASSRAEFAVELTYVTSRGRWYQASWKGDESRSGGVTTNIGIHLFDVLTYVFGPVRRNILHLRDCERAAGYLECDRARVRWFLSIDRADLPRHVRPGQSSYRSIEIDGDEMEFSDGFGDLHTDVYRHIVSGRGFGLNAVRPSVELVAALRCQALEPQRGERHPMVERHL